MSNKNLLMSFKIIRAFLKLHCVREHPVLSLGPLKSYFLLGKIQDEGQSAGNRVGTTAALVSPLPSRENKWERGKLFPFLFGVLAVAVVSGTSLLLQTNLTKVRPKKQLQSLKPGSLETIREVYILKNNLFKLWFIGFLEGKGSFIYNKNGNLEFKLTHVSTDASTLFFIKKELGFGVVRIQDRVKNTHCFKVNDEKGLLNLITILNGNLFLETRQKEFKSWVDAYNDKYGTTIVYLKNLNKPNLSDSWLSGFTDAVGSFNCTVKDKLVATNCINKNGSVKLSYTLSKSGNYDQMKYLADLLNGKIHLNNDIYEVTVNTTKLSILIKYLNLYSLKTNKYIVYFNIRKIYFLVKNNKPLTSEDIKLLTRYKNNLNRLHS